VDQLIKKNAHGPYIDLEIILLLVNHFRGHVFVSATKGRPFSVDVGCGPAKITELNVHLMVQENVLRLSKDKITLISRWKMLFLWRYSTASRVWMKILKV
jgi:hypothetical protein